MYFNNRTPFNTSDYYTDRVILYKYYLCDDFISVCIIEWEKTSLNVDVFSQDNIAKKEI